MNSTLESKLERLRVKVQTADDAKQTIEEIDLALRLLTDHVSPSIILKPNTFSDQNKYIPIFTTPNMLDYIKNELITIKSKYERLLKETIENV